jgi:hypothetical protein
VLKRIGVGVLQALGALLVTREAAATTLPTADVAPRVQAGAGLTWAAAESGEPGWAAAVDAPIGDEASLGVSFAGRPGTMGPWSVRGLYRLVRGDATTPSVAALGAAWGPGAAGPGPWARPALGFALAYVPWPRLTLRLDLGYSFPTPGTTERWTFVGGAPCFGAEVGWQATDRLEVTAGLTGAGELLGVRARL